VAGRVRPEQLGLLHRLRLADDVGHRLPGRQIEVGSHLPELEVEVHDHRAVGPAHRGGHAEVRGDRRDACTPLGREDDDEPPPVAAGRPDGGRDRRQVARSLEAQDERLDPGLELAWVEGPGDHVVSAGLEEADPLIDIVGARHAEHRDRGQGGRAPDLAAEVGRRTLTDDPVEDDDLVIRGRAEARVGIRLDDDLVAGGPERAGGSLGLGGVGADEEDRAGRHERRPPNESTWVDVTEDTSAGLATASRPAPGAVRARLRPVLSAPRRLNAKRGIPIEGETHRHAPI
jgi:hypothetical protein